MRLLTAAGALAMFTLAGCSASSPGITNGTTNSGGTHAGGGSGGGVTFAVTINWTGPDPLQGSFTDTSTGSGYSSCSEYGTRTGVIWESPSPGSGAAIHQVQGKTLGFLYTIGTNTFHGPGTYPGTLTATSVQVGNDSFLGSHDATSSVTVNADGSGNASFGGLLNFAGTGDATESGTITWTCSG
ncbi:MAG: hypothetical protein JOZ75_07450 [Candidatus Dormibacteraeota bacterium]|nr:hypothetical protein [Candidatus Dormibacteraeota bacterium]